MTRYEYRAVPAPQKPGRGKGDAEARFAETIAAVLNTEAQGGWEFLRAETLPRSERQGLTGARTVFATLLVFRRKASPGEEEATREALRLLEDKSEGFHAASDTDTDPRPDGRGQGRGGQG